MTQPISHLTIGPIQGNRNLDLNLTPVPRFHLHLVAYRSSIIHHLCTHLNFDSILRRLTRP